MQQQQSICILPRKSGSARRAIDQNETLNRTTQNGGDHQMLADERRDKEKQGPPILTDGADLLVCSLGNKQR